MPQTFDAWWNTRKEELETYNGEERFAASEAWVAGQQALGERVPDSAELDPAGAPKTPLTVLEAVAVDACNLVKAWAESDRAAPFPEDAHAKADLVLMMAATRRKGVR